MAIGFDNANSVSGAIVSTVTIPAFAVAGADSLIFVGVGAQGNTASSTTSVVRNTTETFTEKWDFVYQPSGVEQHNSGHYFVAPATGSYSIVVVIAAAQDTLIAGAISLTGVHQSTPTGTHGTASGTSATASVTVTAAADEWLCDFCLAGNTAITVGADQTFRFEIDNANGTGVSGGGSTQPGSVAGDVMTWTLTSERWTIGAVPIKPAMLPAIVMLTSLSTPIAGTVTMKVRARIVV